MWCCCLGMSLYLGLASGLETMVAAYGAQHFDLVGILLQKNLVVMAILYVPILVLMLCAKQILSLWNDDLATVERAAYFCRLFAPTIFLWGCYYMMAGNFFLLAYCCGYI